MTAPALQPSVGAAWDAAAKGWNHHRALIRAWLESSTAAMLEAARLQPGDRVLDVAAGAGDQTIDVAHRIGAAGTVFATDLSPGILRLAEENLREAGVLHQVKLRQADAQALGPELVDFDAAVSRLGLMFCPEPVLALKDIHRALRMGGRLGAVVFSGPEHNPCIAITMRTALKHAGVAARDPFAPGALLSLGRPGHLAALMHEAGFGEIEVRAVPAPFFAPRCEDYVRFVREGGSPVIELLKPLSDAAREAAWADIAAQLDQFSTPDGWLGPNELLICSGVKVRADRR
jgi:ubiquinone/menaquinone biosynthesis C-methylase UbiE